MSEDVYVRALPLRRRIRVASREWTNWLQFARYAAVGMLGWAISIGSFALRYEPSGEDGEQSEG